MVLFNPPAPPPDCTYIGPRIFGELSDLLDSVCVASVITTLLPRVSCPPDTDRFDPTLVTN